MPIPDPSLNLSMQKFTFDRKNTGLFTDQQNKLAYDQEELLSFIGHTFSKENIERQISDKNKTYSAQNRAVLTSVLKSRYSFNADRSVLKNIELLAAENSYTITTGHQLSIFTGPVFFIYKILHVIRMCEELKNEYPENNFIPVFWMASEDHDFEEIQSVDVFGKNLSWDTPQKGAVGGFELGGLDVLKKEVASFFENHEISDVNELLEAYSGKDFGEATFHLVNRLFEKFGLLIVDGDDPELKKMLISVIEKELTEQFSYNAVHKTNEHIIKEGFKVQVNAREINLFYLADQSRERILHVDEGFFIEGKGHVDRAILLEELKTNPENFSPNVILRPLYQEIILPNLCYVGGVGEISYWLQLKGVFDKANVTYPLVQARTSIIWIDPVLSKKISKAEMVLEDLFLDVNQVKNHYLKEHASEDIDFNATDENFEVFKVNLIDKIIAVDPAMDRFAEAEMVKMQKQYDSMKEKMVKTVKQQHDNAMRSIDQVFEKVFPHGGMQERSLNLFTLCPDGKIYDKLDHLHSMIDPFDPDLIIIRE